MADMTAERIAHLKDELQDEAAHFGTLSADDVLDLLALLDAHAAALRAEPAQCSRCEGRGTITYWDSQGSHEMPCLCQGAKAEPAGLPAEPDGFDLTPPDEEMRKRYEAGEMADLGEGPDEPAPGEDERAIEKLEAWLPMGADKDKVILYIEARLASFAALKQERDELKGEVERLQKKVSWQHSRMAELLDENDKQFSRAETAEAALAGLKPLIQAIEKWDPSSRDDDTILNAAEAYREKSGG